MFLQFLNLFSPSKKATMPDEIRNAFNILHNTVEIVLYALMFSHKFLAKFLETEAFRNYSRAGSITNKFWQYFLNLFVLFVCEFNPNLHKHCEPLESSKDVWHSFNIEKHLKKENIFMLVWTNEHKTRPSVAYCHIEYKTKSCFFCQ